MTDSERDSSEKGDAVSTRDRIAQKLDAMSAEHRQHTHVYADGATEESLGAVGIRAYLRNVNLRIHVSPAVARRVMAKLAAALDANPDTIATIDVSGKIEL
jgi:hypothetical protein